jgi:PXPV repeat (3 copies)
MFRTAVWSVLGLIAGLAGNVAQAQFYYPSVGYSYPASPVYLAPIQAGYNSYYYAAPVITRPVSVTPVVRTVYSSPIQSVSYSHPAPVYVAPAPVYVSHTVYSPVVVRESLRVHPYSTTYRAQGCGYSVYEKSTPHRTVTRVRAR